MPVEKQESGVIILPFVVILRYNFSDEKSLRMLGGSAGPSHSASGGWAVPAVACPGVALTIEANALETHMTRKGHKIR